MKVIQEFRSIQDSSEKSSIVLMLSFWGFWLVDYLRVIIMHLPKIGWLQEYFTQTYYILFVILSARYILNKLKGRDLLFYIAGVAIYGIQYFIFPDNVFFLNENYYSFAITAFPMFLLGVSVPVEKWIKWMSYISGAVVVSAALYYFFLYTGLQNEEDELMGISYMILPHVLLLLDCSFRRTNIVAIALSIIGSILLFSLGTRGPIICELVFVILVVFLADFKHKKLIRSLVCVLTFFLYYFLDKLLLAFQVIFGNSGLSTRLISLISGDEFFLNSSSLARQDIYDKLFSAIKDAGPLGYGICGDRVICGFYAHNLSLELIVSFGVFLGVLIHIALFIIFLRGYRYAENQDTKYFFLILFCCSVIKLYLSGTFITDPFFYWLIGYCISIYRLREISN